MKRRVILSSIIVFTMCLVSVFSVGIFHAVMSLEKKPEAADGSIYLSAYFHTPYTDSREPYLNLANNWANYTHFYIVDSDGFDLFMGLLTQGLYHINNYGSVSVSPDPNHFAGKYVYLTNDITISSFPSTSIATYFSGTFDGQGHYIKYADGLIKNWGVTNVEGYKDCIGGLFDVNLGTIKNVELRNVNIEVGGSYCGAGSIVGINGAGGDIFRCIVNSFRVESFNNAGDCIVGGIACQNDLEGLNTSDIYDCMFVGSFTSAKNAITDGLKMFHFVASGVNAIYSVYYPKIEHENGKTWVTEPAESNLGSQNTKGENLMNVDNFPWHASTDANASTAWFKFWDGGHTFTGQGKDTTVDYPIFLREFIPWTVYTVKLKDGETNGTIQVNGETISLPMTVKAPTKYDGAYFSGDTFYSYSRNFTAVPNSSNYFGGWSQNGNTLEAYFTTFYTLTFKAITNDTEDYDVYTRFKGKITPEIYVYGTRSEIPWRHDDKGVLLVEDMGDDVVVKLTPGAYLDFHRDLTGYNEYADFRVYSFTLSDNTVCEIRYETEGGVLLDKNGNICISPDGPGYTISSGNRIYINSNREIKPEIGGGYAVANFKYTHLANMYSYTDGVINETAQAVDYSLEVMYEDQITYNIAEDFKSITYYWGGNPVAKYTCIEGYKISQDSTGAQTITDTVDILPDIVPDEGFDDDGKLSIQFSTYLLRDDLGVTNTTLYPTYTLDGEDKGELTEPITIGDYSVEATISSAGYTELIFTLEFNEQVYIITYSAEMLTQKLGGDYYHCEYEYTRGITFDQNSYEYMITSDANVNVYYKTTTMLIDFIETENAYLYAPLMWESEFRDVEDYKYKSAVFASEYMDSTNYEMFSEVFNYKTDVYEIEVLERDYTMERKIVQNENESYLIYVLCYTEGETIYKVEVAQYFCVSNLTQYIEGSDRYEDGEVVNSYHYIHPEFETPMVTFEDGSGSDSYSIEEDGGFSWDVRDGDSYFEIVTWGKVYSVGANNVMIREYSDISISYDEDSAITYCFDSSSTNKRINTTTQEIINSFNEITNTLKYYIDGYEQEYYLIVPYYESVQEIAPDATEIVVISDIRISPYKDNVGRYLFQIDAHYEEQIHFDVQKYVTVEGVRTETERVYDDRVKDVILTNGGVTSIAILKKKTEDVIITATRNINYYDNLNSYSITLTFTNTTTGNIEEYILSSDLTALADNQNFTMGYASDEEDIYSENYNEFSIDGDVLLGEYVKDMYMYIVVIERSYDIE